MSVTLRLLRDLVLVQLAPRTANKTASGLIHAEGLPTPTTHGIVRCIGPRVKQVRVGDVVMFDPMAGDVMDGYFRTPHVVVSEQLVECVVEKRQETRAE
ncbi:MAG: hypothetical protein ABL982_03555 [Vicinamibacterales bacterium]